jgi:hypothetical protein
MKANKTMKRQAAPNHKRIKDKESENNIHSAAHIQTLKHQKQLNDMNHHKPIILTLNINRLNSQHQKTLFGNLDKKGRSNNLLLRPISLTETSTSLG